MAARAVAKSGVGPHEESLRLLSALARIAGQERIDGEHGIEILRLLCSTLGYRVARWWVGDRCLASVGLAESSGSDQDSAPPSPPSWVVEARNSSRFTRRAFADGLNGEGDVLARYTSVTTLPMVNEEVVVGIVELLGFGEELRFGDDEAFLTAITTILSSVVARYAFQKRFATLKAERDGLHRLAVQVSEAQTEDLALRLALDGVTQTLGWDYAIFWFYDQETGCLNYAVDAGTIDVGLQMACMLGPIAPGQGVPGRALEHRVSVVVDLDQAEDARLDFADRSAVTCMCATRVADQDRLVGVLEVGLNQGSLPPERAEGLGALGEMLGRLLCRVGRMVESTLLAGMVESSAAPMVFCDTNHVVTYANPAAAALFAQMEGKVDRIRAEMKGEHLDALGGEIGFARRLVEELTIPAQVTVNLGPYTLVMDFHTVRDKAGESLGLMCTIDDVTERLRLRRVEQEAREAAERMQFEEAEYQRKLAAEQARQAEEDRVRARAERERALDLESRAQRLLQVVEAAARGDLRAVPPNLGDDAIGQVGRGVGVLMSELRRGMSAIAGQTVGLSQAATQVGSVADRLAGNANAANEACFVVDRQSQLVEARMRDVQGVVQRVERSIQHLGDRVTQTRAATSKAVAGVRVGREFAGQLSSSAADIGSMVGTIRRIASQTKLLALNASIEAARSGEAGRGFGVVATEVKSLAREVESATQKIDALVTSIRSHTADIGGVLESMVEVVSDLSDLSDTVSAQTGEQTELTGRIRGSVSEVAEALASVVGAVGSLQGQTSQTSEAAGLMQGRAGDLATVSGELRTLVSRYQLG